MEPIILGYNPLLRSARLYVKFSIYITADHLSTSDLIDHMKINKPFCPKIHDIFIQLCLGDGRVVERRRPQPPDERLPLHDHRHQGGLHRGREQRRDHLQDPDGGAEELQVDCGLPEGPPTRLGRDLIEGNLDIS